MANPMALSSYRQALHIDDDPEIVADAEWRTTVFDVLRSLSLSSAQADPGRALVELQAFLAPMEPGQLTPSLLTSIEAIAAGVLTERGPAVNVDELPTIAESIPTTWPAAALTSMYIGDITSLRADAIVNAANSALLGCRLANHPCIDNAIHAAAGPRLREDCAQIIALQGHGEPVGGCKLTRGHALPARYVMHTVGPQLTPGATPTDDERALLASCYRRCLDTAAEHGGIASVGFCAISTGVFAYPKSDAANVALSAVADWTRDHPDIIDRIVFNVFSETDALAYQEAISAW